MSNTIRLKNYLNVFEEMVAAAAITPGHLVEMDSDGKAAVHSDEDQNALPMFALEDELQGETITDAYSENDQVPVWIPTRGDQVYAILAESENVAIGDFLSSAGDGTLKKHVEDAESAGLLTVYGKQIIGQAIEAVHADGATARIKVRIV